MKRLCGSLLALVTLTSLAWVAIPVILIRPFSAQTPRGLSVSYDLRRASPGLTLVLLSFGCIAFAWLWPRVSRRLRAAGGVAIVLLAVCAWFARQNHFEWMFKPIGEPRFAAAADVKDVAADDLVLGVSAGGEARAYPVLALAYHHIVNDALGDEPIVATY